MENFVFNLFHNNGLIPERNCVSSRN